MTRNPCIGATILSIVCLSPSLASVDVQFSEYLPLQVGNRWTLVDEFGTVHDYHVADTEVLDGEMTYQFSNWEGNPGYANLTYSCGALKILGIDGTALDPARIYDGQDIDNPAVHIVYEMEPVVQTPAGAFHDVIKETIYSKKYGDERKTRVQYFAKGVGLVRDEEWSADAGGIHVYTANLASCEIVPNWLPMWGLNIHGPDSVVNLYLYDLSSGDFRILKEDCNGSESFMSLNAAGIKAVYLMTSAQEGRTWIRSYNLATQSDTVIRTIHVNVGDSAVYFDANDMILFNDISGQIKRMDGEGRDAGIVATPETPYRFSMFWLSPDRTKMVAIENESGWDYNTSNYERLVLLNSDGSGRRVLRERYLGEWNFVSWKPDSSGLIYYYHTFNGEPWPDHVEYPEYMTFDVSQDPIVRTDLAGSDLAGKDENVCFYTRTGNLLSITTGELYDPCTGSLLADCSAGTPSILAGDGIVGTDLAGGIYFADADGRNFRELHTCACRPLDATFFDGFESGGFSPLWQRYGGDAPWTVTDTYANGGLYSAQAGPIGDGQTSTLTLTYDCGPGDVAFFLKVGSELGWDKLSFRIDGILKGEWSGKVDWTHATFPVTAGTHTFEWTYQKDSSTSEGPDTAWIDDVTVPAHTE